MAFLIIILTYIFIGFVLDTMISEHPDIWGVFLWPALLAGCIIAYLDYQKENKEYYDEI